MTATVQDVFAGIVAVLLVAGVLVLALQGKEVPEEVTGALGLALGWLFRGGLETALTARRNGGRS